ncbi:hypothetical protein NW755_003921 [Fusarium falciforme]|uniref:Uncharacterized protein n=1 Tax=Fusarium falciforme TaxID=195108 RepID=A0A9W8V2M5_9HYPO|nr:hypothetical protein NW755_003921 [Fusarium falciforme]
MSHTANASSRLTQSSREDPQPSSPEPSQTAVTPDFGQLIRLLKDKLAQSSDADISLSMDDTHELVRALRFSKDANNRLQVVEQELAEAKQRAGDSPFLGKFGDYSGHVWNDLRSTGNVRELPQQVTDAATLIEDRFGDKGKISRKRAETLRPPLTERAARCAAFAYSARRSCLESGATHWLHLREGTVRQYDQD